MKKYFRDRLRGIMKLDDPPHRLALAFALGVFIAFSPWIGLHILSAIFLAWIFRLSKVVVLTGSFLNNPWTIVPMYGFCLWVGVKITGSGTAVPAIAWDRVGARDLFDFLVPYLWPFAAGTLLLGSAAAVLSYFLFRWAVTRYRRQERAGDQRDAAREADRGMGDGRSGTAGRQSGT